MNQSRRQFIRTSTAATAGILLNSIVNLQCAFKPGRKPNIIYILADDLGYGDLSCYGQQKFSTPNIDRLAAEGKTFTNHYAGSTVCAPSRCSLMTGLHTGHCTIRGNWSVATGERVPLKQDDFTVAESLKQAGYETGIIGKWGLGEAGTSGIPNKKGFDFWFGYLNQRNAHFYYPPFLWRNEEKFPLTGNSGGERQEYSHDLFTEEALKFIREKKDNPFFLYLAYTIPHAELLVPEDDLHKFKGTFPETPYEQLNDDSYNSQAYPHAAFAAMVTRMDRDVGRILDLLKQLGLDEDTIVFFSSDNGPHEEGGGDPKFFDSAGNLRGIKRDLYEGGIRVPLLVRWHGKIQAGTSSNHVSAFWDFLPTAAAIAGVNVPIIGDGISFLPALLGKEQPEHEYLYWEFTLKRVSSQALRMGDWKAVHYGLDQSLELYNLQNDPGETTNVAAQFPDIINRIEHYLKQAREESPDFPLVNCTQKKKKK